MSSIVAILLVFLASYHIQESSALLPLFPDSILNNPEFSHYVTNKGEYDRIVGGTKAQKGEFPFQVSIQRYSADKERSYHFCGGSIVSPRVIVSAGHCAKGQDATKIRICTGALNIAKDCDIKTMSEVSAIKIHHEYDPSNIDKDISTFILATPLTFSEHVAPVPLPSSSSDEIKDNTVCVVSGWGTTSEGGGVSKDLLKVEVPTVGRAECKESYSDADITDNMLCAGEKEGGKDTCQGDSGGPLISKESGELRGITSWGYGCARPGKPGVYTNVVRFTEWIREVIADNP